VNVIQVHSYDDLSRSVAEMVMSQISRKPSSLCVFPTGQTPCGLFRELVDAHRRGAADFSRMRIVSLDEYVGLAHDDRRCLSLWLGRELLQPLGISGEQIYTFDAAGPDSDAESARIEKVIADCDDIDLAIVGLGPNGHVGFNEPGSAFDSRTRRVALTAESIRSNAAYWGSEADVPRLAFTLGLGTLLDAQTLILMVSGPHKAAILSQVIDGPVTPEVPATVLRLHADGIIIADREAMSFGHHP
jgi:glucosamine-6-phosphate deaminase